MEQPRLRRDSVTNASSSSSTTAGGVTSALTTTVSASGRRTGMMSTPSIDLGSLETILPPPMHPSLCSSASSSASTAQPLSTYSEIVKVVAMLLDPEYGLSYLDGVIPLPKHSFCGYDLTNWLIRNLVDVVSLDAAVKYAQSLLDAGYISHASGNRAHKFLNGFFFYTLLAEVTDSSGNQETNEIPSGAAYRGRRSEGEVISLRYLDIAKKGGRRSTCADASGSIKPADIRKISFPRAYLPPENASPLGPFATDFQKEWMEVLFVRNAPPPSRSSISSVFYPPLQPLNPSEIDSVSVKGLNSHLTTGILSSAHLSRIFGASNSPDIHVGSDGVLRKRVTRDLRDSSNTSAATQALKEHPEWYCLLYDLNYHPTCAFGMEIQWLVASPSRLNEMLLHFLYYKATSHGFSIVPAPCYPFLYSGTRYSMNPFRMPIFVPCRIYNLVRRRNDIPIEKPNPLPSEVAAELFPELPESEQMVALFYFQERILSKFGFIPLSYSPVVQHQMQNRSSATNITEIDDGSETNASHTRRCPQSDDDMPRGMSYTQRMFVHVSGGMFAMIPTYPRCSPHAPQQQKIPSTRSVLPPLELTRASSLERGDNEKHRSEQSTPRRTSLSAYPPSTCSYATTVFSDNEDPGEAGIQSDHWDSLNSTVTTGTLGDSAARLPTLDSKTSCFEVQTEVGFFWMWNHMLPRRWRGQTTVEEVFDSGMLEDLRSFCSGGAYDGSEDSRILENLDDFRTILRAPSEANTPK
ncbi:hypothetical protein Aperf_G00000079104 [Anoplocephala perfoliata]